VRYKKPKKRQKLVIKISVAVIESDANVNISQPSTTF